MSTAGGEPRILTDFGPNGGWAIQPSWTPDGESISFVAEDVVRSHPNAATIAADGTGAPATQRRVLPDPSAAPARPVRRSAAT